MERNGRRIYRYMEKPLKVLSIGSDRRLFEFGSAVSERIKEYGKLVEELHVVVFALKSLGLKEKQLVKNVWIHPTNSLSRWFYVHDAARLGKKIVYKNNFVRGQSIITAQDPFECGLAGLKVKKKWRLPLEVQLHTDPFSPYFSGFLNNLRKRIAKSVLRHASHVRVMTESLKAQISSATPAEVSVLPVYLDRERIENAPIKFDIHARLGWHFIMLSVARLSPEKNLPFALEVLRRVQENFPNTGLVIVGAGKEEGKLRVLARELGVKGNVSFEGWQEDIASYYKTSNVFLQTSVFEGYGMALVEAGLSGLPVVTTPVGIALELEHGKDAYIYPHDNADAFVEGIVDLIEHNAKRENLRANLKRTLQSKLLSKADYMAKIKDSWEKTAQKVR